MPKAAREPPSEGVRQLTDDAPPIHRRAGQLVVHAHFLDLRLLGGKN